MSAACRIITKYKQSRIARSLEFFLLIPWLLPAILISVGLLQTYNDSQWTVFGATLGGTIYLLILGYVVNKIPYTLRMTKAAFYSIDGFIFSIWFIMRFVFRALLDAPLRP